MITFAGCSGLTLARRATRPPAGSSSTTSRGCRMPRPDGLSVFTAPIHRYTATGAYTVRFMFEKAKIISDQKHCRNTAAAHIAAAREATSRLKLHGCVLLSSCRGAPPRLTRPARLARLARPARPARLTRLARLARHALAPVMSVSAYDDKPPWALLRWHARRSCFSTSRTGFRVGMLAISTSATKMLAC